MKKNLVELTFKVVNMSHQTLFMDQPGPLELCRLVNSGKFLFTPENQGIFWKIKLFFICLTNIFKNYICFIDIFLKFNSIFWLFLGAKRP